MLPIKAEDKNGLIVVGGQGLSLVAMGDDSYSRGRGFEFQHRILYGLFRNDLMEKLYCLLV